ncbi:dihydrolipoamide acetyltransferase family protein [Streptomyces sp. 549]|uniref:dihydrolipoamide acetyltransferase family protein n=1 Tax=Streptomyces sp. 549 TaxID=3049076 RepID=UPI0024C2855C|nr:dihydrolipoamide acetyltransferase family protein [Streptomyces sp. 549]MDK1473221.1 dihydrolipoamide acetyltransferase family protein [Streptomyces sp. 549]
MPQVREFALPDLGEGLTEAEISRWLVEVGEVVAVDQPVVEVETAKAMVEVPCPYAGVVTGRFGEVGDEIPVGAALVTVAESAETGPSGGGMSGAEPGGAPTPTPTRQPSAASAGSSAAASAGSGGAVSGNVLVGYGTSAPPRRRRRVQAAAPERKAAPAAAVISPLVRRIARERGIDLRELTGSGPQGLILRSDVERAVPAHAGRQAVANGHAAPAAPAARAVPEGERVPLKGVLGAVADKLSRSRREIPDATCWVDADATELLAARRAMNEAGGAKVSLLALLARICTAALARFPELNAFVDTEARELVRLPAVHLGFAAQTPRGLVVPVVTDAHTRSAVDLTAEFSRLTDAARQGRLAPAQLTGGTFTLNNYGVFGVDGSTPILNHPEAAMLGVGRITEKPWVHQGELAVRHVVQLSFTFDHRVCDGGTAGGFLRYVADCVEQPAVLLRTL